jgi:hypothetical protein
MCRCATEIRDRSKKNMVQQPSRDRKSPKMKTGVLGKARRYRARKRAYFWMKLVFYWGRLELMLVHNRGQEYAH